MSTTKSVIGKSKRENLPKLNRSTAPYSHKMVCNAIHLADQRTRMAVDQADLGEGEIRSTGSKVLENLLDTGCELIRNESFIPFIKSVLIDVNL